ncbi:hypothetical protein ES703_73247 [subsurface metagenome]
MSPVVMNWSMVGLFSGHPLSWSYCCCRSSVFLTSDFRAIRVTITREEMLKAAARFFYLYVLWVCSKLIKAAAGGASAGVVTPIWSSA